MRLLRRNGLRFLLGLELRVQFGNPTPHLGVKLIPADLGNDGSIIGLVDREDTSALGAFQFVHIVYLIINQR